MLEIYTLNNLEELSLDNSVAKNYFIANTLFLLSIFLSFYISHFIFKKREIGLRLISKNKIHYNSDKNIKLIKLELNLLKKVKEELVVKINKDFTLNT